MKRAGAVAIGGGLLLLVLLIVALDPKVRAEAFGPWGYQHLTSLVEKIQFINDPANGWAWDSTEGESFSLACAGEYIPHSGEFIEVTGVDPVRLSLVVKKGSQETRTPMEQLDERTFRYESRKYPITITARVIAITPGIQSPTARIVVKAAPR